jgi:hypothetical protein
MRPYNDEDEELVMCVDNFSGLLLTENDDTVVAARAATDAAAAAIESFVMVDILFDIRDVDGCDGMYELLQVVLANAPSTCCVLPMGKAEKGHSVG